ncbi:hypothetical protein Patl1_21320 [Pistacia atlantica]|uniref:Uncharacterized protein n=1 Tax=Pistacia atlantica TaxID=434234 RepID=A0ACC1BMY8_9ROSI|nr:hypothetical protein Patl1_21320 [Pistacia atlantica]
MNQNRVQIFWNLQSLERLIRRRRVDNRLVEEEVVGWGPREARSAVEEEICTDCSERIFCVYLLGTRGGL